MGCTVILCIALHLSSSLEYRGIIDAIASGLKLIIGMKIVGRTLFYWISALLSGFVEHNVCILTMLYTLKYLHFEIDSYKIHSHTTGTLFGQQH